jgi:hypothetical protein
MAADQQLELYERKTAADSAEEMEKVGRGHRLEGWPADAWSAAYRAITTSPAVVALMQGLSDFHIDFEQAAGAAPCHVRLFRHHRMLEPCNKPRDELQHVAGAYAHVLVLDYAALVKIAARQSKDFAALLPAAVQKAKAAHRLRMPPSATTVLDRFGDGKSSILMVVGQSKNLSDRMAKYNTLQHLADGNTRWRSTAVANPDSCKTFLAVEAAIAAIIGPKDTWAYVRRYSRTVPLILAEGELLLPLAEYIAGSLALLLGSRHGTGQPVFAQYDLIESTYPR